MNDEPNYTSEVSIRDIAAAVGCSHASVSRALRGEAKVGQALREKILKTAKDMNYRPNPMVASLMATQNRKKRRKNLAANLAWLNTHPNRDFWHLYPHNQRYIEAAKARAHELGYGFDELWPHEKGMSGRRLKDIAQTRGIQGFLLAGSYGVMERIGFEQEAFAIVCIADMLPGQKHWHRVGVSSRQNTQIAFRQLKKKGYRRIALALAAQSSAPGFAAALDTFNAGRARTDDFIQKESLKVQLSGYYYEQAFTPKTDRVQPFIYDRAHPEFLQHLAAWLKDTRPQAVIGFDNALLEAAKLAGLDVPGDLAIAHLNLANDVAYWAGVDIHPERQACAAVDILSSQVERNQRGVPEFARYMHISGQWKDGWTASGSS